MKILWKMGVDSPNEHQDEGMGWSTEAQNALSSLSATVWKITSEAVVWNPDKSKRDNSKNS